jgi:hypothetical protein
MSEPLAGQVPNRQALSRQLAGQGMPDNRGQQTPQGRLAQQATQQLLQRRVLHTVIIAVDVGLQVVGIAPAQRLRPEHRLVAGLAAMP